MLYGPRRVVTHEDVDFVISLHYETPKAYDCFSWGALWNPIDFYVEWGVSPYLDHQFSHDGYFLCGSMAVEAMARTELGDRYETSPFVDVNHTLAGPIYPPRPKTDRRVAYCGINWERLSGKKGRFDDLLKALDRRHVLDIYGPANVRGVAVWEGFDGYRNAVPFDGVSMMGELAQSGAVLALSSPAHIRSGVMSNRLFEAAAAGALVFSDNNPFIERFFKDEVIQLDLSGSAEDQAQQIELKLRHYNEHPEEALEKCQALQRKFLTQYSLHRQLLDVYRRFGQWEDEQRSLAEIDVGSLEFVILNTDEKSPFPGDLIRDLAAQNYKNVKITLVTSGDKLDETRIRQSLPGVDLRIVTYWKKGASRRDVGMAVSTVLATGASDYYTLLLGHERVFRSYARDMLTVAGEGRVGAVCGMLVRHYDSAQREFEGVEHVNYVRAEAQRPQPNLTLGHMILNRQVLLRAAGAMQFMNWPGLIKLLERAGANKLAVIDKPLLSGNLKDFERRGALNEEIYEPGKATAVTTRYLIHAGGRSGHVEVYRQTEAVSRQAILALSEDERRLITIDLLKTLPVPTWFKNGVGRMIRLVMGIRRPPPPRPSA
ncbi:hypothetical protein ASD47_03575 [Caulobacter sp. Root1472]|nr:hypothetical protein ASD47_03575 [Caulobacter sp. Root1472]